MTQILIRFVVGGVVVSAFAMIGEVLRPKSFAGLFGAAPSVALATIALTVATDGPAYAGIEAHSMMVGAIAFLVYALCVSWILLHYKSKALWVTISAMPLWFAVSFGLWRVWLNMRG